MTILEKRKLRLLQCSLKGVIISLVVASTSLAFYANRIAYIRSEDEALSKLSWDSAEYDATGFTAIISKLERIIAGTHTIRAPIQQLSISSRQSDKNCANNLKKLRHLSSVFLLGRSIDDAELRHYLAIPQIEKLCLTEVRITCGSLEQLQNCRSLRSLSISNIELCKNDIAAIGSLHQLSCLRLKGTHLSTSDVETLRNALHTCEVISE